LEKVIDCRLQTKVLEGRGHQAVRDVPDQLDGIIYNLLGIVDALQLGRDILVNQVVIQVKTGCSQQWAGVIMKISCNALPFFFLPPDGCIEENLLLLLFKSLKLLLVLDDLSLVKYNEYHQAYGKHQHP
jgi:hypothetical protein